MRQDIVNIANSTIVPQKGTKEYIVDGKTEDIIAEIMLYDQDAWKDVRAFASHLKDEDVKKTAENIYNFIKQHITYIEDPGGNQFIKYPRALWGTKYGDCKSMSLMTGAILKNLNIPYAYRFTKYKGPNYKHVYVVIPREGEEDILIDCVWNQFDDEKEYSEKKDIMTKIYKIGNPSDVPAIGNPLNWDLGKITMAQLYLYAVDQRVRAEIDAIRAKNKNANVDGLLQRLKTIQAIASVVNGNYTVKQKENLLNRFVVNDTLKDIMNRVKEGLTTPVSPKYYTYTPKQRQAFNKLLIQVLPAMSPYFIYSFLNDNQGKMYLTPKGYVSRQETNKELSELLDLLELPAGVVMYMIHTEFLKRFKQSPQSWIAEYYKKKTGIGIDPAAIAQTAIEIKKGVETAQEVASVFKGFKKPKEPQWEVREDGVRVLTFPILKNLIDKGAIPQDKIDLMFEYYKGMLSPEREVEILENLEKELWTIPPKAEGQQLLAQSGSYVPDTASQGASQAHTMRSRKWC